MTAKTRKAVLKEACKIRELEVTLENICQDDGIALDDLSIAAITAEAKHLLELFGRSGTDLNNLMTNDFTWLENERRWGMSEQCKALRRQYRSLKSFIARREREQLRRIEKRLTERMRERES